MIQEINDLTYDLFSDRLPPMIVWVAQDDERIRDERISDKPYGSGTVCCMIVLGIITFFPTVVTWLPGIIGR